MAAVKDTFDRFKKISEASSPQPFENDNDGGEDRGDRDDGNAKGSDKKGKGRDHGGRKGRGRGGGSPKKRGRGNKVEESSVDVCRTLTYLAFLTCRCSRQLNRSLSADCYSCTCNSGFTILRFLPPFVG